MQSFTANSMFECPWDFLHDIQSYKVFPPFVATPSNTKSNNQSEITFDSTSKGPGRGRGGGREGGGGGRRQRKRPGRRGEGEGSGERGGEKKAGKLTPDAFPDWQRSAAAFVVCRTNPCCPLAIDYGTNLLGRRDSRRAGRCETLRGKDTDANTS